MSDWSSWPGSFDGSAIARYSYGQIHVNPHHRRADDPGGTADFISFCSRGRAFAFAQSYETLTRKHLSKGLLRASFLANRVSEISTSLAM
jgi:hypothetical protein